MSTQPNPFDEFDAGDGYRVVKCDTGKFELALEVSLILKGEIFAHAGQPPLTQRIWQARAPKVADYAARSRIHILSEAICQYFNAGGNWDELEVLKDELHQVLGGITHVGWHLFDSYIDTECHHTTVWVNEGSDQVVVWVADEFIDHMTMDEFMRRQEEDADDPDGLGGDLSFDQFSEVPAQAGDGTSSEDAEGPADEVQE